MKKVTPANTLPVYDRAVARFPHLCTIPDAKTFCQQLCRFVALPTITAAEYMQIAAVANGGEWREV